VVETRVGRFFDSYEEFLVPVLKKNIRAVPVPVLKKNIRAVPVPVLPKN
jgi:hypothetical protein